MQLRRFLQFTAEETLAGRSDDIKEYSMLAPSPELNRAVAVAMASGPRAGLESAEAGPNQEDTVRSHRERVQNPSDAWGNSPGRGLRQARKASTSSGDR